MRVEPLTVPGALADVAADWDRLSRQVPFRSFDWLDAWWRHYSAAAASAARRLCVLAVRAGDGALIGLAPWWLETTLAGGRVLRFLGSGEIYSDYLSVLAQAGQEDVVAQGVAEWLTDAFRGQWDALELSGVDAADPTTMALLRQLRCRDVRVYRRPDLNCWRIELPARWDDYLGLLSKSHRKQIRRAERRLFATGRAAAGSAGTTKEVEAATERLIQLHQRRHQRRGARGAFSSPRFAAFHRELIPRLVATGKARLNVLRIDGQVVAVEYLLLGSDVVYAYQSGIDPAWLRLEPGRLSTMVAIGEAIAGGFRAFDFLRGDEPYKAHWRACPRATLRARAVPRSPAARARNTVWLAQDRAKQWIKRTLKPAAGASTWPLPHSDEAR
jgi:CelD/BcsL family acetyltransferase involved in cellulose biosynthesis